MTCKTRIEWVDGPMGQPASRDWRYWTPRTPGGRVRAWFHPDGLPGPADPLLGEFDTVREAMEACQAHADAG